MKNRIQFLVLLMLVVVTVLAACDGEPVVVTDGVVPDSLQTIEGAAEDIIDFAPGGNWDKINTDLGSISDAWKSYQPQATKDNAPQATQDLFALALAQLEAAATAKDAAATMQSANDLSAAVFDLYAVYNPKIPADIGQLDVWERQIVLDVAANNFDAAATSLAKVKSVWEDVKRSILEHNGKDVAAQFEASIATQANALTAKDGAAVTSEAKNGLELVDALEQVYSQ